MRPIRERCDERIDGAEEPFGPITGRYICDEIPNQASWEGVAEMDDESVLATGGLNTAQDHFRHDESECQDSY